MLIQGTCNSEKINLIAQQYINLINNGNTPKDILVILLNAYKKSKFIKKIKQIQPNIDLSDSKIYTFAGLCYNAFKDNWDYIADKIHVSKSEKPNLCGLEVSRYIFRQCIKEADFSDYISKVNLLHQLFRRYSLIVHNMLDNNEIFKRSSIINETFAKDAQKAIEEYKRKTIELKSFDYLRQYAILPEIYNNTDYFGNIKFLLADDVDEMPYNFWRFVDNIMPNLIDFFIGYDKDGSTRCGYLCAFKSGVNDFKKKYSPKEIILSDKSPYYDFAQKFFSSIQSGKKFNIQNINFVDKIKRLDMLEEIIQDVKKLLNFGVKPNDIAIISPLCDEVLNTVLRDNKFNIKFFTISGNEKLLDNNTVKYVVYILKLSLGVKLQSFELKTLLINLLNIPCVKCYAVVKEYENTAKLPILNFQNENYDYNYKKLVTITESLNKTQNSISEKIKVIYSNLLKENDKNFDKNKFNFLIKEAESFEAAFDGTILNLERDFILQIENSIISENSSETFMLNKDCVIVSTPQKIVDCGIKVKYRLWADISSGEWFKEDKGTLYNAWVFNRDWEKNEFTLEDNINLTKDKTARIVRKTVLCAQKEIKFYSSLYDNSGNENFGGLSECIKKEDEIIKKEFNIIPRPDQEAVLNYKNGKMGIMAVPGAGKTTILLALIIKLLQNNVASENIFVLTYMESAAKNFKERIKFALSDTVEIPNISTIHGLALRIIKENSNYTKIGLEENFEICDDNTKEKIIKELFFKNKIDEEKIDNYLRCISIVKLSENSENLTSKYKDIQDFYNFYNEYNKVLKQNNYLDYDDMLCNAVKILENNKEILNYYQTLCKYIIEDEAQDSTDIQQRLLSLLSGKYRNIIRCGDINQAITSTFTNSNIESFKNFMDKSQKVEMSSSQRCALPIYTLANNLVDTALKQQEYKNAFYSIQMQGTEKNPKSSVKPQYQFFKTEKDEKYYILNKIKEIRKFNPKATCAILLRLNSQVNDYNEFFSAEGVKTTLRTDSLCQKKIYKIIYTILKIIENPINNKNIVELAQIYKKENYVKIFDEDIKYIENLKGNFINLSFDTDLSCGLSQLLWDVSYWLNNSTDTIENLALKTGLYYSKNSTEKSNTYLIATFIKKIKEKNDGFSRILNKLEYYSSKTLSAYKFFEEECSDNENEINIMTMHKSKGDEFDYVFIPQLNEDNYPIEAVNVKLKNTNHFIQTIKMLSDGNPIKTNDILKNEQIHETLRLLYVGITRAKSELYLSSANENFRHKKVKISSFLTNLI